MDSKLIVNKLVVNSSSLSVWAALSREVREMNRKFAGTQATVYIYNHKEANTLRNCRNSFSIAEVKNSTN